ncbi:magnesium transporter MgtE N-terminal domain-containing protein [Actinoplanes sp. NPDC049681]|uniref:magnesium transporter MgtE N-terminal domain-containing protein n=1 Tax=Actinoplanes sp. NPDC049681 TaxID=3363905 RepID=UPI00378B8DCD
MPTGHVVTMLNASPPQRAVGVLLAMPRDRIDALLAAMDGRLIARMLIAAEPERRAALLGHLDDARLAAELALLPLTEAAAVLAALPATRARPQLDRVTSENLAMLLDAMPGPQRRRLVDVLDPLRLADLRRVAYEKKVIESLRRTAAGLHWVPDDPGSNLLAGVMHRLFGISLCYVDRGSLQSAAVAAAQRVFADQQVHGLLLVTNAAPSVQATEMLTGSDHGGTPTLVVTWDPDDNDGVLGRALVRLAG